MTLSKYDWDLQQGAGGPLDPGTVEEPYPCITCDRLLTDTNPEVDLEGETYCEACAPHCRSCGEETPSFELIGGVCIYCLDVDNHSRRGRWIEWWMGAAIFGAFYLIFKFGPSLFGGAW